MFYDKDLKENLIVTREGGARRRRAVVIVLVLLLLTAAAAVWRRGRLPDSARQPPDPEPAAAVAPTPDAVDPGGEMISDMRALAEERALVAAREKGHDILERSTDGSVHEEAESLLAEINMELIQTPLPMPEKETYIVQRGDSLERIAGKFGTTVELLRKSNALRRDLIHPGDVLRVFNGTFEIEISKSRNDLVLLMNDRFFKRYQAGTGKHGTTPAGVFKIADKIAEPPWWRPDGRVLPFGHEENVLGTRWMSIAAIEGTADVRGYGIHGTWEPETIGRQESEGCVRLLNHDVEELFMLVPVGTRVVIFE